MTHASAQQRTVVGKDRLVNIFTDLLVEKASWPRNDLKITGFDAVPETLVLPAGKLSFHPVHEIQANHLGRNVVVIEVLVDGRIQEKVKMSGDLRLLGDVCYTTRKMRRHTVLTKNDITVMRGDITMLGSNLVSDPREAGGKILRTSLQAGAILYKNMLDSPPLVERGDLVTIVARSGPLQVTTPGEARQSGAKGDRVRVKNLMSRKEIHARVLDTGSVEVVF